MASVSFQFHAARTELLNVLLPRWLDSTGLHFATEFEEDGRRAFSADAVPTIVDGDGFRSLLVSEVPFRSRDRPELEFLRSNVGFLSVQPGSLTIEGLRESMMSSVSDDPSRLGRWRKVINRARRDLSSGVIFVNPYGERFDRPSHRYSDGALELAGQGVPMLAVGGTNRYELAGL